METKEAVKKTPGVAPTLKDMAWFSLVVKPSANHGSPYCCQTDVGLLGEGSAGGAPPEHRPGAINPHPQKPVPDGLKAPLGPLRSFRLRGKLVLGVA